MNRKASIQDILMIAIFLFMIGVGILIVYKVNDEINTEFQAEDDIDTYGKDAMTKINSMFPGIIDNSYLVFVIGLALVAFMLATLVRVHPVFLVFYFLILLIIIFVCGVFSNVYQEIAADPEFTALADEMVFSSHVMNYLPFIVGIFGSLLAIVMYKLFKSEQ